MSNKQEDFLIPLINEILKGVDHDKLSKVQDLLISFLKSEREQTKSNQEFGGRNKSDFEKLVVAKMHIKQLEKEKGFLISEKDEAIYNLEQKNNELVKISGQIESEKDKLINHQRNEINRLLCLTKEERKQEGLGVYKTHLIQEVSKTSKEKIKKLEKDKAKLFNQLVKLKNQ